MKTSCDIIFFNNKNKVYFSGDTICGKVSLNLTKEKTVRGKFYVIINKVKNIFCSENNKEYLLIAVTVFYSLVV